MNPHLSHFTEKSLRILLKRAGFVNVEFHLAPYDTYDNDTGRLKSIAIAGANIAAIGIRAATLGRSNRGFQLFLRAEKPPSG